MNAIQSPLLDIGIERATGIVWNITGGSDLTLFEVGPLLGLWSLNCKEFAYLSIAEVLYFLCVFFLWKPGGGGGECLNFWLCWALSCAAELSLT